MPLWAVHSAGADGVGVFWPPKPASNTTTVRPARKPRRTTNGPPRPGRTVRARLGLEVSGHRLAYPIGTYCALNKEWEKR